MTSRKPLNPIALAAAALKAVRCAADYHRLSNTTEPAVLESAWNKLTQSEQQRLTDIVNTNAPADPQSIADELTACGTLIHLQAVKATYGDVAVKSAWKLLPVAERDRLTAICKDGTQPDPDREPTTQPKPKPKTLSELTADIQQLDAMLDTIEGDIPPDLQQAVDELFCLRGQRVVLQKLLENKRSLPTEANYAATPKI